MSPQLQWLSSGKQTTNADEDEELEEPFSTIAGKLVQPV
jgi:hypothetical protein